MLHMLCIALFDVGAISRACRLFGLNAEKAFISFEGSTGSTENLVKLFE